MLKSKSKFKIIKLRNKIEFFHFFYIRILHTLKHKTIVNCSKFFSYMLLKISQSLNIDLKIYYFLSFNFVLFALIYKFHKTNKIKELNSKKMIDLKFRLNYRISYKIYIKNRTKKFN